MSSSFRLPSLFPFEASATRPRVARLFSAYVLLFAMACTGAQASEAVRPFVSGSFAEIMKTRSGKPFILSFWSLACTHCPAELKHLAGLARKYSQLDLVVVSTDGPERAAEISARLREFGLQGRASWVFADPMPERLRFEIDRRWYGELPRTYFFDRTHRVEAVSGLVPERRLLQWAKQHL